MSKCGVYAALLSNKYSTDDPLLAELTLLVGDWLRGVTAVVPSCGLSFVTSWEELLPLLGSGSGGDTNGNDSGT